MMDGGGGDDDLRRRCLNKMEEELQKIQHFPRSLPLMNQILSGVVEKCRKQLPPQNVGRQSEGSSSQTSSSNDPVLIEFLPIKASSSRQENRDSSKIPITIDDGDNEMAVWANCAPFWRETLDDLLINKGGSSKTAEAPAPAPAPAPAGGDKKRKDRINLPEETREMDLLCQLEKRLARKRAEREEATTTSTTSDWRWRLPPRPPRRPPQQKVTRNNSADVPSSSSPSPSSSFIPFAAAPLFPTSPYYASHNQRNPDDERGNPPQ